MQKFIQMVKLRTLIQSNYFSYTREEATYFHKVLAEKLSDKTILIRRGKNVHSKTDFYHYTDSICYLERKNVLRTTPINDKRTINANIMGNTL